MTVSVAVREPAAPGVNVTGMVQVPAAGMLPAQVFPGSLKSVAFVPEKVTDAIFNAALPLLVSVIVCAAAVVPTLILAKVSEAGESEAADTGTKPVPVSAMVWGLSAALSVSVMVAVCGPDAVGVKVAEMVQVEFAGRVFGQVLVKGN